MTSINSIELDSQFISLRQNFIDSIAAFIQSTKDIILATQKASIEVKKQTDFLPALIPKTNFLPALAPQAQLEILDSKQKSKKTDIKDAEYEIVEPKTKKESKVAPEIKPPKITNISEFTDQLNNMHASLSQMAKPGLELKTMMDTLANSSFASPDAMLELERAGISTQYLADESVSLGDKMKHLQKVQADTGLMTKVFGKENLEASLAMIKNAESTDKLSKNISQPGSFMDKLAQSMDKVTNRGKAMNAKIESSINVLKVSFSNIAGPSMRMIEQASKLSGKLADVQKQYREVKKAVTETIVPMLNQAKSIMQTVVSFSKSSFEAVKNSNLLKSNTILAGAGAWVNRVFAKSVNSISTAFRKASFSAGMFSVTLMNIPVIGWILAGIALVIVALTYLWNNCRKFREILGGIGGAAKAIFHNIGVFVNRLWEMVIKPIAGFILWIFKAAFLGIWNAVKSCFNSVMSIIQKVWNTVIKPIAGHILSLYKKVFLGIWNTVKSCFNKILSVVKDVWNWIKKNFGGFATWLTENLVDPIYNAFNGVWDWIVDLFGKLMDKLTGIFAPIKNFFKKLFSSEGMQSVTVEYKKEAEKSGKAFDEEQKRKKQEEQDKKAEKAAERKAASEKARKEAEEKTRKARKDKEAKERAENHPAPTSTLGKNAAMQTKQRQQTEKGEKSGGTVRSLNINKLIEKVEIHQHQGSQESKESLMQMLREALLTAVSDFTIATP